MSREFPRPKVGRILSLGEARLAKENAHVQGPTVSEDAVSAGTRESTTTVDNALIIAQHVIDTLTEDEMLNDFIDKESRQPANEYLLAVPRGEALLKMRASLAVLEANMSGRSVEDLVRIFDTNQQQPDLYEKTYLMAAARALVVPFQKVIKTA